MNTEHIWENFREQLLGYIMKHVKDPDLADDILQEVFIKIHQKLPTLNNSDQLSGWLYTITRNTIIDHFRKKKTHRKHSREFEILAEQDEQGNEVYCQECLKPFIGELSKEKREAILATDLGPLTQKEYAAEIGVSYSGLKSRVQRGRQQLNELFKNCCVNRDPACSKTLDCGCPA